MIDTARWSSANAIFHLHIPTHNRLRAGWPAVCDAALCTWCMLRKNRFFQFQNCRRRMASGKWHKTQFCWFKIWVIRACRSCLFHSPVKVLINIAVSGSTRIYFSFWVYFWHWICRRTWCERWPLDVHLSHFCFVHFSFELECSILNLIRNSFFRLVVHFNGLNGIIWPVRFIWLSCDRVMYAIFFPPISLEMFILCWNCEFASACARWPCANCIMYVCCAREHCRVFAGRFNCTRTHNFKSDSCVRCTRTHNGQISKFV